MIVPFYEVVNATNKCKLLQSIHGSKLLCYFLPAINKTLYLNPPVPFVYCHCQPYPRTFQIQQFFLIFTSSKLCSISQSYETFHKRDICIIFVFCAIDHSNKGSRGKEDGAVPLYWMAQLP